MVPPRTVNENRNNNISTSRYPPLLRPTSLPLVQQTSLPGRYRRRSNSNIGTVVGLLCLVVISFSVHLITVLRFHWNTLDLHDGINNNYFPNKATEVPPNATAHSTRDRGTDIRQLSLAEASTPSTDAGSGHFSTQPALDASVFLPTRGAATFPLALSGINEFQKQLASALICDPESGNVQRRPANEPLISCLSGTLAPFQHAPPLFLNLSFYEQGVFGKNQNWSIATDFDDQAIFWKNHNSSIAIDWSWETCASLAEWKSGGPTLVESVHGHWDFDLASASRTPLQQFHDVALAPLHQIRQAFDTLQASFSQCRPIAEILHPGFTPTTFHGSLLAEELLLMRLTALHSPTNQTWRHQSAEIQQFHRRLDESDVPRSQESGSTDAGETIGTLDVQHARRRRRRQNSTGVTGSQGQVVTIQNTADVHYDLHQTNKGPSLHITVPSNQANPRTIGYVPNDPRQTYALLPGHVLAARPIQNNHVIDHPQVARVDKNGVHQAMASLVRRRQARAPNGSEADRKGETSHMGETIGNLHEQKGAVATPRHFQVSAGIGALREKIGQLLAPVAQGKVIIGRHKETHLLSTGQALPVRQNQSRRPTLQFITKPASVANVASPSHIEPQSQKRSPNQIHLWVKRYPHYKSTQRYATHPDHVQWLRSALTISGSDKIRRSKVVWIENPDLPTSTVRSMMPGLEFFNSDESAASGKFSTVRKLSEAMSDACAIVGSSGSSLYPHFFANRRTVIVQLVRVDELGLQHESRSDHDSPWFNANLIGQPYWRVHFQADTGDRVNAIESALDRLTQILQLVGCT
jgi:hypothetical protein